MLNYKCTSFRGLVKWYNNGLQNHCWEFDSLIPCHLNVTPTIGVNIHKDAWF